MTENKRFTVYGKEIVQGDECWAVTYSEYNADVIATALNELAEEKEELESFKKLVYLVLKKEYDLRMNEMNILAEKEDWQGYMATKLERGTAQRIAKRLGVDLE